jgi:integrase
VAVIGRETVRCPNPRRKIMATLGRETYRRKDGTETTTYRILIGGGRQARKTIRLGTCGERVAQEALTRINDLEHAHKYGTRIEPATAAWVAAIRDDIHGKLAQIGLVEPRKPVDARQDDVALAVLIDRYMASRANLKPNTVRNYETTKRLMVEHFGAGRSIRSINAGHAKDYREWLAKKYAQATVAREIKRARQYFEYAVDCQIITSNPFSKVKAGKQTNSKRKTYVSRETIDRVLEYLPDNDWRLVLTLARYGGLRIPSELQSLTWNDINWHDGYFVVRVPKKEHIDGHESRKVPLFAEIMPYLRQAFEDAPPRTVHVVPARFHADGYFYAGLIRALERAGIAAWPKLMVNMRASRAIDLRRQGVNDDSVNRWLGHTQEVAEANYLADTPEDFRRASGIYPAQNPAQSGAFSSPQKPSQKKRQPQTPRNAKCTAVHVPPRGVEESLENKAFSTSGEIPGTISGHKAQELGELLLLLAAMTPEERQTILDALQLHRPPAG